MRNIKELKSNKGVTLVALVVTIIVLIILAGVSINLVLGDNGIIKKSNFAKTETEEAKVNEEIMLNEAAEYIESSGGTIGGDSTLKKDRNGVEEGKSGYLGSGYDDPYIPIGFTHIGTASWNSGYQIQDSKGNVFVWVPCVLDQEQVKDGDTVETFKKTLPLTTEKTDPYYKYNTSNLTITGDEEPANVIKTSVGTYGGFYIAAYEAGIEGTKENLEIKTAADGSVKPLSKSGCGVWNNINIRNALIVAASMIDYNITGVHSGLISGECWDTTLQWMVKSSTNAANEPNAGYDIDSTGKGWYTEVSNGTRHTTGYYEVNNIYDMAGNVNEWTTENGTLNDNNSCLVARGGGCSDFGSGRTSSFRGNTNGYSEAYAGFRVVLYK